MAKKNKEDETRSLVLRAGLSLADHQGEWLEEEKEPQELSSETISEQAKRDEIFHSFARKIAKVKRLSDEEEYALGQRIRKFNDKEARKKLVLHNMRLALKMAHQYRREWTSLMDLVQEASAGMAIAAQKWDPDVGTKFGTYAAYWIRAQLTKFLMTNARLIHTGNTRAGRKLYYSLPQVRRKLLLAGKEPTVDAIAKEVGEDPKEVALILARLQSQEASISQPPDYEGNKGTLEDTLASSIGDPEKQAARNEVERLIQDLIAQFESTLKDERDLAIWRENLIANEPVNLVDLGKRYNVSKQRMGQLATRIKRAFRCHIIEQLGPTTHLSWLFRED
jgi:RNA polymerase sigma-32 factor